MEETNGAGRMKCESQIESRGVAAICRRPSLPKPAWERTGMWKISFMGAPQRARTDYLLTRRAGMTSKRCGGNAATISAASYTRFSMPTQWNVDDIGKGHV